MDGVRTFCTQCGRGTLTRWRAKLGSVCKAARPAPLQQARSDAAGGSDDDDAVRLADPDAAARGTALGGPAVADVGRAGPGDARRSLRSC